MRPRRKEDLNDPERIGRIVGNVSQTPRYLREYARSFVGDGIDFLARVFRGEERFEQAFVVKDGKDSSHVEVVSVSAPAAVRVMAVEALLRVGVPQQLGLVDNTDGQLDGVLVLPALAITGAREALSSGSGYTPPLDADYEVVYEDEEMKAADDEETIDPAVAALIVARRMRE